MIGRLRSVPRHRRFCVALIVGVTATITASAPSPATAAVTIGSNLAATPGTGPFMCTNAVELPCTLAHRTLPATNAAADGVLAPSDGVVVRWRIKVGNTATPTALRIIRPGNSDTRTGAGTSATVTPAANAISTFDAQLPIRAGDTVGIDCCNQVGINAYAEASAPDVSLLVWNPRLLDGEPARLGSDFPLELLINADIEPDADCDAMGDETQDPSVEPPGNCPQPQPEPEPEPQPKADGTLTIDANKGKVEKGRKVTLTGQLDVAANESCEPGRAVQIQRRLKSQDDSKFATFTTLNTDAAGNYTTKFKVKKTYFYRAIVSETETCADETSNLQKVRVQKKKAAQEA
jgi:hypothetical protein